ncbi:MAG: hypothetical protein QHC79_23855 [Pseudosphingobacterium sp.]|nr:hypothetical protein [Pseudosphingobacterium sp.]
MSDIIMQKFEHLLIFKTSIEDSNCKHKVARVLDQLGTIETWSVDLSDEDYVLRVVSPTLSSDDIMELVHGCGFECEILS